MKKFAGVAALALAGTLVVAGCGDDDDSSSAGSVPFCDISDEISDDMDVLFDGDDLPSQDAFNDIIDKMESAERPDEISEEIGTVIDSMKAIRDEVGKGEDNLDEEALFEDVGNVIAAAETIGAYTEDNCG